MGTPGYMAPEIVRGAKPSPRSDLFSLGAVAYRLSEGVPGLPSGLYEAVQRALAPEPDARQESAAEFRAQLLDGHTPPSRGGVVPFPDAVASHVPRAA
jgi:serine/threonine protein kinase